MDQQESRFLIRCAVAAILVPTVFACTELVRTLTGYEAPFWTTAVCAVSASGFLLVSPLLRVSAWRKPVIEAAKGSQLESGMAAGKDRSIGLGDMLAPWAGSAVAAIIGGLAQSWPFDTATFVPAMFYSFSFLMFLAGCAAAIFVARGWLKSRGSN